MTEIRIILILIFMVLVSACASSGGRRQILYVNSTTPGSKIIYDDKILGETPALVEVPRKSSLTLTLQTDQNKTDTEVEGKYRWGRSFAGNLGFLTYAPVGWLVDLLTGAAWEYNSEVHVETPAGKAAMNERPQTIAIAPLLAAHPNIADEAGALVNSDLSAQIRPPDRVLPYNQTLTTFNDWTIDNDGHGSKTDLFEVSYRLKATQIYFGEVDTTSDPDKTLVKGKLQDVLYPEKFKDVNFSFEKSKTPAVYDVGWNEQRADFITWMPNSIFVIPAASQTSLTINQVESTASEVPGDGFVEKTTQVLAAISLKNFLPPSKRQEWRYHFRLSPNLSFSYGREKFDDIPALNGVQFKRFHTDVGWGPSFNYGNNRFNLYFNIFPTVAYDSISSEWQGKNYYEENVGITVGVETGIMMFIKERWSLQIFSRSASVPTNIWENIISDITNTKTNVDNASFIGGGIAVGYTFPNKDLPF